MYLRCYDVTDMKEMDVEKDDVDGYEPTSLTEPAHTAQVSDLCLCVAAEVGHPYLLSPRLSELPRLSDVSTRLTDLSPPGHNAETPPSGPISSLALPPPTAAFMASPNILGAFQPYSPLLPMMADSKTPDPLLTRALTGMGTCSSSKRPRGEKKPIPDDQKDEKYYERRKRNNQAAKKSRDARKIREDQNIVRNGTIKIGDLSFEEVEKFRYLGATVTNINDTREEIKRRINMGNACYYSVEKLLSSSLLSKNLKVRIHKTVILPVVVYGCETWTLTLREEQRLRVFENKVLRKIFGAKRDEVTGEWRKLHNGELHALYSSPDIIRNIKSRRLRWAGHVARIGESRNAYRVLVGRPEGKRPLGRARRRWEDNIEMDMREVGYDDSVSSYDAGARERPAARAGDNSEGGGAVPPTPAATAEERRAAAAFRVTCSPKHITCCIITTR
ncbi:hypothetical protein ANN_21712 [Periplaneta americana]|uniref:BZIP domain-containing protein n=1 Tax=Periplaneta americana TaxID=6978 RepID=A0ABQ8S6H2_PERAM|nr:hypothetical protein ANN_21712 [Periplaneta americana]